MVQVGPRARTSAATKTPDAPPAVPDQAAPPSEAAEAPKSARRRYSVEIPIDPEYLPFIGLMFIGLVLRFWDLGAKAFHHDESLHAFYSWRLYDGQGYVHDPMMHGPLLFELLPRITPEGVLRGVPGLRAVLHHRWVELYALGSPAKITLANVPYRHWAAALAFADVADPGNPLRWLGNDAPSLRREEHEALERREFDAIIDFLLSALLRRSALFSSASNLVFRHAVGSDLEFEWCGPSVPQAMAARLVHPITGLIGTGVFVAPRSGRLRIASAMGAWAVTLGRVPTDHIDRDRVRHAEAMWSAWNKEMARSNATWTSVITSSTRSVRT